MEKDLSSVHHHSESIIFSNIKHRGIFSSNNNDDMSSAISTTMLPKLYSTIDEVNQEQKQHSTQSSMQPKKQASSSQSNISAPQTQNSNASQFQSMNKEQPHLFLHFDVNETILIGDPAGGDTVTECLNKIIAKSAFVSTTCDADASFADKQQADANCGERNVNGSSSNRDKKDDTKFSQLKRSPSSGNINYANWWNGLPITTSHMHSDVNKESNSNNNNKSEQPPPLYTGWTYPPQTCPYYRTSYKSNAKTFTEGNNHGWMYRPLYDMLCEKLGIELDCNEKNGEGGVENENEDGAEEGEEGKKEGDIFKNFVPAFFQTLQTYFPSTASSTDGPPASSNTSNRLPPPTKVTLVLRTFGTDLPLVAKVISEFAKSNHPMYPNYYNEELILDENSLFCSKWRRYGNIEGDDRDGESGKERKLIWELHPIINGSAATTYSGDDEVLNYLQSKSIVGIQDNYPFWRDANHEPWAGKLVWARTNQRGSNSINNGHYHNHHHILLDDNIHNDPNDEAGGIRIPVDSKDESDESTTMTSYESLHGNEALAMHGKHMIRVPTIRPLLEDDWFIRQIEGARWRLFTEEHEGVEDDITRDQKATDALILSSRDLTDADFNRVDVQLLPPDHMPQRVDVSRNKLKYIPTQIFSYSMLTFLDVSRNMIQGLPAEIRHLTNLVTLTALSNHMRMKQIDLEALTSLKHLRLLDLRYNRKLKQAALTTFEDALLPNNSQLEIRCTVPLAKCQDSTTKSSACDRDATLLQSQLEPISTPQLLKRLQRSFGVKVDTEEAYDREFVMKTILQCYEKHGPRQIRYEKGIPVAPHRLESLLAELESIAWPRTTRERPKILSEYYMILQKPGSGKEGSAKSKNETAKLMKYKRLFDLAVETLSEVDASFASRFTALAVTKNFVGSPHIDTLNVAPFYGISLGEFQGGGSIAVECSPFQVAHVDTKGRFGKVDGRWPHWVTDYEGTRYSLIYYVTSGIVEPQTTAIFKPPPDTNNKQESTWIPPPSISALTYDISP